MEIGGKELKRLEVRVGHGAKDGKEGKADN